MNKKEKAFYINMERKAQQNSYQKHHKDRSTVVQTMISVVSTLLVLFTLFEMQAERNAAYRPSLSLSDTEIAFVWDEEKILSDTYETPEEFKGFVEETTTINRSPEIDVYNVGVGTAKKVEFEWNNIENINQFVLPMKKYCDTELTLDKNGFLSIKNDYIDLGTGVPQKTTFDFISNSSQDTYSIVFPNIYYYFMVHLCKYVPLSELDINFSLTVSYCDIQGKSYSEKITIIPEMFLLTYKDENSGFGIYNLVSKRSNSMNYLNINNLTSICALVMSFLSIIISIYFSHKQMQHNKNSVRPISYIQVCDYENLLSVKIANVGTGPLTIITLRASINNHESPALIDLMPDIKQDWSTFIEDADGRTIPVDGEITLIEIEPKNDMIKDLIRSTLSKTTITLEYSDIYKTKFYDERKLDFFARHTK